MEVLVRGVALKAIIGVGGIRLKELWLTVSESAFRLQVLEL